MNHKRERERESASARLPSGAGESARPASEDRRAIGHDLGGFRAQPHGGAEVEAQLGERGLSDVNQGGRRPIDIESDPVAQGLDTPDTTRPNVLSR